MPVGFSEDAIDLIENTKFYLHTPKCAQNVKVLHGQLFSNPLLENLTSSPRKLNYYFDHDTAAY